jgi:hypothetical protein
MHHLVYHSLLAYLPKLRNKTYVHQVGNNKLIERYYVYEYEEQAREETFVGS